MEDVEGENDQLIKSVQSEQIERSESPWRWLVLPLSCFSMFANLYCFDNPAPVQDQLQASFHISALQYNYLYMAYSIPNVILPLFAGLLVDALQGPKASFIFLSFIVVGQAIFVGASTLTNGSGFELMVLARIIFGFGGESLSVAQNTILSIWFIGKDLAFAMGINQTIARLGTVGNDNLTPVLAENEGLRFAFLAGLGILLLALIGIVTVISIDSKFQVREQASRSSISQELREVLSNIRPICTKEHLQYWMLVVMCVVVFAAINPFHNIANSLLQERFGMTEDHAGTIMSLPFIISCASSPFVGLLLDKFGHRDLMLIVSCGIIALSHLLLAIPSVQIEASLVFVIFGIGYCLFACSLYPSVSHSTERSMWGTAFGIMISIQNIGLMVTPIIVGWLRDVTGSYKAVEWYFACCSFIGMLIALTSKFIAL
jgi:MFS family permease